MNQGSLRDSLAHRHQTSPQKQMRLQNPGMALLNQFRPSIQESSMAKLKTCLNQRALRNQKTRQGPQNPQKQFYPSCASPPEARPRVIGMHARVSRATLFRPLSNSRTAFPQVKFLKKLAKHLLGRFLRRTRGPSVQRNRKTSHEPFERAAKTDWPQEMPFTFPQLLAIKTCFSAFMSHFASRR